MKDFYGLNVSTKKLHKTIKLENIIGTKIIFTIPHSS